MPALLDVAPAFAPGRAALVSQRGSAVRAADSPSTASEPSLWELLPQAQEVPETSGMEMSTSRMGHLMSS